MIHVITCMTNGRREIVEVFAGTGRLEARAALTDHLGWLFEVDNIRDQQSRDRVATLRRSGNIDGAFEVMKEWLATDYIVEEHSPILHTAVRP